jgi:hypothetical protein
MKKRTWAMIVLLASAVAASADIGSLSHVFLHGNGLKDTDGDGLADKVALTIVIPDNPTASELAVAADIAARANFESLAQEFGLVKRESEVDAVDRLENAVLIGLNVKWLREAVRGKDIVLPELGPTQGYVAVYATKTKSGILLAAGSDEALLQTGRAFFLRWPYLWDIWGRAEGATYDKVEKEITQFLAGEGVKLQKTIFRSALYEFPPLKKGPGALKRLTFNAGEVKDLAVDIVLSDEDDQAKTVQAFGGLRAQHDRGLKTDVLSYPGCAQLTFWMRFGKKNVSASIPRVGAPKRLLTPSFRAAGRESPAVKDFDLTSVLSTKGFYGDIDRDGIPDTLESKVIVPQTGGIRGTADLASKLVLNTAGASFPVVYLDKDVDNRKGLVAPLLVGPNTLVQELQRVGKLDPPALPAAFGTIEIVPKAFNASNALVLLAADSIGIEKTLAYFNRTFPYFQESRSGRPQIGDVVPDLEKFLKGEKGAAEAFFLHNLKKTIADLKDKTFDMISAEMCLPRKNPRFEDEVRKTISAGLKTDAVAVQASVLTDGKNIFEKEQDFSWEGADALAFLQDKLKTIDGPAPVKVSVGVSESPGVRQKIKKQVEAACGELVKAPCEVDVLSSYKQGFFWILEKVVPALKGKPVAQVVVKFAKEAEDFSRPKRFYAESSRWLQELYPIDEIIAKETGLSLDKIHFEIAPAGGPTYRVVATDAKNAPLLEQTFTPETHELPYLKALPEWGSVRVTTGWVRLEQGGRILFHGTLDSDLEKFWEFYQTQVLTPLYAQVLRKTNNEPTYSKQPYFKQLRVELWASEPDFKLGLDEEIVSSLEAMHDEVYFDTLDFLRGITEIDLDGPELPEDTSRVSAPGNIFPVIHPSTEGEAPRVKVTLEDWTATTPSLILKWKEKGRDETSRRFAFPALKSKALTVPALVYNGLEDKVDSVTAAMEFERETDYLTLLDILAAYREISDKGLIAAPLSYPNLAAIKLRLKTKDMEKDENLPVAEPEAAPKPAVRPLKPGEPVVDTGAILSPEMVDDLIARLAQNPLLQAYVGGSSYERRPVPVIEVSRPSGPFVSLPRLIAQKPTLYLIGRQHANEVSSTNYLLKLAEMLATDKATQDYVNKMNFVIQPLENPDGAALAYELQKLTPFHSLHAGRYSALGLDVGSMTGSARPILPEALVRRDLTSRWQPDIVLNLHGYPSHEWVQQFSNYSPFLFREYWIPRGWYVFYNYLDQALYKPYKEAGEDLRTFIINEMQADPRIKESNKKFYERYERWAGRWQPHLDFLELYDGLNIYSKRRSSSESRLSQRTQTTFVSETPELMDETARDAWLEFLSTQGLAYLRAHLKYLAQAKFEVARFEEETGERIRIQFVRGRPGTLRK